MAKKHKSSKETLFINFIKEYWISIIAFFCSTFFFIWQYSNSFSWDYQAFVLGGKYFFENGTYLEPLRPPLTSFLFGMLGFISWNIVSYLLIIFVGILYFYAIYLLSKVTKLNFNILYVLSFSSVFLLYAFINSSELFSLTLFILFLVFLINDSYFTGIILGLAALARYNFLPFGILLLFHKSWKKIIISMSSYVLIISPWLIYNYLTHSNFFTSIADQYAINIVFRDYMAIPFNYGVLIQFWNILLPLLILGIILVLFSKNNLIFFKNLKDIKKLRNQIDWLKFKLDWFMIIFGIFVIRWYAKVPLKDIRYMFYLFLPTIYFCTISFNWLIDKLFILINTRWHIYKSKHLELIKKLTISCILIVFLIISLNAAMKLTPNERWVEGIVQDSITKLNYINLSDCQIASNAWVPMSYLGLNAIPMTRNKLLDVTEGKVFVYFKYAQEREDKFEEFFSLQEYMIYNNSDFYIFSNGECLVPKKYDTTYLELLNQDLIIRDGQGININPCFILFNKYNFVEGFCNWINFNGFTFED